MSIKANELRIGNWVMDENREQFTVTPTNIKYALHDKDYKIFPIPLTPEILEQCGCTYFKSDGISSFDENANDPDGVTHCWTLTIKRTELVDSHEISIVKWGEQEYFTFQLGRGTYRQKIKNFHQLQNLYFALTGTELVYTPLTQPSES